MTAINYGGNTPWERTQAQRQGSYNSVEAAIAADLQGLGDNDIYVVQAGDTFFDIAEAIQLSNSAYAGADTMEIANQLMCQSGISDPYNLPIGTELDLNCYLPDEAPAAETPTAETPVAETPAADTQPTDNCPEETDETVPADSEKAVADAMDGNPAETEAKTAETPSDKDVTDTTATGGTEDTAADTTTEAPATEQTGCAAGCRCECCTGGDPNALTRENLFRNAFQQSEEFMAVADLNADGLLTADEIQEPHLVPTLDTDGDGALNTVELSAFYIFKDSPVELLGDVTEAFTPEDRAALSAEEQAQLDGANLMLESAESTTLDMQVDEHENSLAMTFAGVVPTFVHEALFMIADILNLGDEYEKYRNGGKEQERQRGV